MYFTAVLAASSKARFKLVVPPEHVKVLIFDATGSFYKTKVADWLNLIIEIVINFLLASLTRKESIAAFKLTTKLFHLYPSIDPD